MTIQSFKLSSLVLGLSTFVFCGMFVDEADAQRGGQAKASFDVSLILKRIDSNGNGMLEPGEMAGRTKEFIRKAGLDPNRAHSISTITKKLKEQGKAKKTGDSKKSGDVKRKVPGFGVDIEPPNVPDFSPSGEERMSIEAMRRKFSASVMSQVDRTMSRYDKDKNGLIDPVEQKRTRWSNPSAEESDTNKDTNLSRLELAYRYQKREDDALKKNRVSVQKTALQNEAKLKNNIAANRNKRYEVARDRARRASSNRSASSRSSSNKPGFSSGTDAYRRYAEGLIKNYDKNGDKKLSKDEMKEMRRPLKNADTNKDGFVDKNELVASVTRRSGGNQDNIASTSGKKSNRSKVLDSKRRDKNKSYNAADSIFGGKDLNNDRQLQMSEFAEEWDEEKVAEFKAKDLNDDGVITEDEWNGI